jgi:hypothetical protein
MTCDYYRTSSLVTALPMIMRWISDVPSKIVKLVEVRAESAGRWPAEPAFVRTNSAPLTRAMLKDGAGNAFMAQVITRTNNNENGCIVSEGAGVDRRDCQILPG